MNAARQAAFDNLHKYEVTLPNGAFNPAELFSGKPVHFEIGFGGGEHLIAQALAHPDTGFIGAEPFINGLSSCAQQIEKNNLTNVRLWPSDARLLLDRMEPGSLQMIYLLFNDPWPKARHAERRFVSPENLARLARVLAPGGGLRIATDDPGLQAWTEEQMAAQKFFAPAPGLYKERPDWPNTRYEAKAIAAGRRCRYYEWQRQ